MIDPIAQSLLAAQGKAAALFDEIVRTGMIRAGVMESELTAEIHALARRRFGLRRHWHRRIVRCGVNTLMTYHDDPADLRIEQDDLVFLDLGPVFDEWEADFGRTYVLGSDPDKHRLVKDIDAAFDAGKALYGCTPDLTAGELYDFVAAAAQSYGWQFGAPTAGHLIGHFPHERAPGGAQTLSIRHGNPTGLREVDERGVPRHWILEIHFVDRQRGFGGFFEELLTV